MNTRGVEALRVMQNLVSMSAQKVLVHMSLRYKVCVLTFTAYAGRGVGDLVLVYRRVTGLAGHTSRVSELLEQVHLTQFISQPAESTFPRMHGEVYPKDFLGP